MTTEAATKCEMCGEREMKDAPRQDGTPTGFKLCPNCDNPNGVVPQFR